MRFSRRWRQYAARAVELSAATILLTAATLKAQALASGDPVPAFEPAGRLVVLPLSGLELLLAVWLCTGVARPWLWRALVATFLAFAVFSGWQGVLGRESCACFGHVSPNPWLVTWLDVSLVSLLGAFRAEIVQATRGGARWRFGISTCALSGVLLASALTQAAPSLLDGDGVIQGAGKTVVLEPEKWVGKKLPLIDFIDIGDRLALGDWEVWLYKSDCPDCRRRIKELRSRSGDIPVSIVELPPHQQASRDYDGTSITYGRLTDVYDWFVDTPTHVRLADAVVREVHTRTEYE